MEARFVIASFVKSYPARTVTIGSRLFSQDGAADLAYYVHRGQFAICRVTEREQEIEVGRAEAGDLLGTELICSNRYLTMAVCTEAGRVTPLPRNDFLDLLRSKPEFSACILEQSIRELCSARQRMLALHCCSALQRVALHLLEVTARNSEIVLPWGSRVQISRRLGMTQETLSRTLHKLTTLGVIEIDKEGVTVLERDRLSAMAHGDTGAGPGTRYRAGSFSGQTR